jgi:hypothetical protein
MAGRDELFSDEEAQAMAYILKAATILKPQHDEAFALHFSQASAIMADHGSSPDEMQRAGRVLRRQWNSGAKFMASTVIGSSVVHLASLGEFAELRRLGKRMLLLALAMEAEDVAADAESDQE